MVHAGSLVPLVLRPISEVLIYVADSDDDLESVHEGIHDLAGSSATKRKRARQILKTPDKQVR